MYSMKAMGSNNPTKKYTVVHDYTWVGVLQLFIEGKAYAEDGQFAKARRLIDEAHKRAIILLEKKNG
jgi:hypothetical protein